MWCIYHIYKADRVLKNTKNSPKWWILHGNKCVKHWLVQVKNMMYKRPMQRWCSGQKHKVYTKICDAYITYTRPIECWKTQKIAKNDVYYMEISIWHKCLFKWEMVYKDQSMYRLVHVLVATNIRSQAMHLSKCMWYIDCL